MRARLDSNGPIFLQLKESIEDDILRGLMPPESQIPSNSQLVKYYGLNPVTVLKAVNLLVSDGLVYKKRGLGMFVTLGAPGILRERFMKRLEEDELSKIVLSAKACGLSPGAVHEMIDRLWKEE
ncbi:MAG: GntR family transcriptional regulator [Clostridiales Family XIII bacterium]|jgi:DNA-binding transcriptional regulator YhcF (GntR family)|nr:GntR family transcriptional regulator [Clostridiales Family XIII bacterium]